MVRHGGGLVGLVAILLIEALRWTHHLAHGLPVPGHRPARPSELPPGAALLRTARSEVCGTDVHLWHGRLSGVPYPIIPGHVSIGAVAKVRGNLKTVNGDPIREGDIVTFLDVHETCGSCYHCLVANQPNRCPSRKVYGITYSANDGLLGGWSEAIYMKPGVKMIHIPENLSAETFIGGGCGLVTALHAVDLANIRLGDSVAVMGAGPVGLELAVALRRQGVHYVQFDAQQIGYTITRWPPRTHFFSSPERIAIAGVPGFSGFFSKDEILWKAFSGGSAGHAVYYILALAAFITAFYSFRLIFMTFHQESRVDHEVAHHIHESPKNMLVPLIILAVLSVVAGFVGVPEVLHGSNNFHGFMANVFGGADPDVYSRYTHVMAADPGVKVHLYGKQVRPGRKIGHVTVLGSDVASLRRRATWTPAPRDGDRSRDADRRPCPCRRDPR